MKKLIILVFLAPFASGLAQQTGPKLPHQVVADWAKLPAGWYFGEVAGVDVDADDNVWVFARGKHPVIQFDSAGNMLQAWNQFPAKEAHALRVGPEGHIWTVDVSDHHVMKSTPEGRLVMILGRHPAADSKSFNRPATLTFAPNGDIYIADGYINGRVMKFNSEGEFLMQFGRPGSGPGEFGRVHDIALGKDGLIYVADPDNYRIQIFNEDGKLLDQWTDLGQIHAIYYVEREDVLYMSDTGQRLLKVDMNGKVLGQLSSYGKVPGKIDIAHYLAVDSTGAIYVAELNNWRVQKFVDGP